MQEGYEVVNLFYDPHDNSIIDDNGRIIEDVSHLMPMEDLVHRKLTGGTYYIDDDEDGITYEFYFPFPDDRDTLTFYFDSEKNRLYDECGINMLNIFSLINPQAYILFKKKKQDMDVYGKTGQLIKLMYMTYKDEVAF